MFPLLSMVGRSDAEKKLSQAVEKHLTRTFSREYNTYRSKGKASLTKCKKRNPEP